MSVAAVASIVGAGTAIYGATRGGPDIPASPDYAAITRDGRRAAIDFMPEEFNAKSQYDPQFAALQRRITSENLFGTTQGTRTEYYNDTEQRTRQVRNPNVHNLNGRISGGGPEFIDETYYEPVTRSRQVETGGTPGLIAMAKQAAPELDQIANESRTRGRTANIADMDALAPALYAAVRKYDPENVSLMDEEMRQAREEQAAGRNLTPAEEREAQQYSRAAGAARHLGYGVTDAFSEAMTLGKAGAARQAQRRQYIANVSSRRAAYYGDPAQAIDRGAGRTADPSGYIGAAGQGQTDRTAINPSAYSLAGQGYAAANNASIAGYNQSQGALGGLIGGAGSIYKAYANQPAPGMGGYGGFMQPDAFGAASTGYYGNGAGSYQADPYAGGGGDYYA